MEIGADVAPGPAAPGSSIPRMSGAIRANGGQNAENKLAVVASDPKITTSPKMPLPPRSASSGSSKNSQWVQIRGPRLTAQTSPKPQSWRLPALDLAPRKTSKNLKQQKHRAETSNGKPRSEQKAHFSRHFSFCLLLSKPLLRRPVGFAKCPFQHLHTGGFGGRSAK